LNVGRRSLLIALGWAVFQGHLLFSVLITERRGTNPIWFLGTLLVAMLASALFQEIETALRHWLLSIGLSVVIVSLLLVLPMYFGVLSTQFVPLILVGSLQPMVTTLILTTPLSLLGCFTGQVLRARLL
jgi:hypothetical protein